MYNNSYSGYTRPHPAALRLTANFFSGQRCTVADPCQPSITACPCSAYLSVLCMEGSGSYSYLSFMTSKVGFWTSIGSDGSVSPVRISRYCPVRDPPFQNIHT